MTKSQFFKYCDTSQPFNEEGDPVELRVHWRTESHGFNRCVYLDGMWANQSILSVTLYCPLAGRQHEDLYQTAERRCKEAVIKFQRWLDEWKAKHDVA